MTNAFRLTCTVLSLAAAPAMADDAPRTAPPPPVPPLGGPAVPPDAGTTKEEFGEKGSKGTAVRGGIAAERRDMELWRRAFQELMPQISPEVQEQVRAIRADFESRMKAWRETNADAIKQFEAMRGKDGAGAKPDPELVRKMQAIKESAPKPDEAQQKIWALLTPEQQSAFKERYDALKKVAMDRKSDRQDRKAGDAKQGQGDPMKPDPMLPGGEAPAKKPSDRPFNFEEKDDPARKGDGKPSGK